MLADLSLESLMHSGTMAVMAALALGSQEQLTV
jgi:hypothetical protein